MARSLLSSLDRRIPMAEESSSSSSIVAIFAIMLIVLIGAFIAWQVGLFGGGGGRGGGGKKLDINVNTGQITLVAR
jgi:hypothetical protein